MDTRVEFIAEITNPPAILTNNKEARLRNKEVRLEIREVISIMQVGQSFTVWGIEPSKVTSIVYGVLRDVREGCERVGVTIRVYPTHVRVWRIL